MLKIQRMLILDCLLLIQTKTAHPAQQADRKLGYTAGIYKMVLLFPVLTIVTGTGEIYSQYIAEWKS